MGGGPVERAAARFPISRSGASFRRAIRGGPHIDLRVLGPLQILVEGREIPLPSAKQRALVAVLLLQAGEVVSAERLVDALWGERPPATAAHALRVHLSELRKAIRAAGAPDLLV